MRTRSKGMAVAMAGLLLTVLTMLLSRYLGRLGGALLIFAIVMELVALGVLARDRREEARTLTKRQPPAKRAF